MTIIAPVRTTLNASTFVAVTLDSSIRQNVDIRSYTEDDSAFLIATSAAGANASTIPANTAHIDKNIDTSTTAFWAKASAGTPVLVTLTSRT